MPETIPEPIIKPLKNMYDKAFINGLGKLITKAYPKFDSKKFKKLVFSRDWDLKELKERMRHISLSLYEVLPKDFQKAVKILKKVATDKNAPSINKVGFELMILPDFVEVFGCNERGYKDNWDLSIDALKCFTSIASSEFAVRPLIIENPTKMMKVMLKWSKDKNHHVRRLASEGCRSRLPWAMALPIFKKDSSMVINMVLPILENLKADNELYVRRSVANNLNDISKDHPALVLKLLKRWNKDKSKNMKWLVKHSLRTLEKAGNPEALALQGYSHKTKVKVKHFKINKKKIKLGESLGMNLTLTSTSKTPEDIIIDYIVMHKKANGKLTPKVFKWGKKTISKYKNLELTKNHAIKEISTRKYHPGHHEVHIQVNGKIIAKDRFHLQT